MFNLFNNDYDDEFTIKIKGLIKLNEEGNPKKILIKKRSF